MKSETNLPENKNGFMIKLNNLIQRFDDSRIKKMLILIKSARFLKNQTDFHIKNILQLENIFQYDILSFLLNNYLFVSIHILKVH